MIIQNKLAHSRWRQARTTHYPNDNINPASEQTSFYKHIPSVILPSSICRSRSPSRCHGYGSCKGLWLAHRICPFSGFVARGRASLSLPWLESRRLNWATRRIWPPLFDSTDRGGKKIVTKYLTSSSLRLGRREKFWSAYLQSILPDLKRKKN
jgi:hypothetical protein